MHLELSFLLSFVNSWQIQDRNPSFWFLVFFFFYNFYVVYFTQEIRA